MLEIASVNDLPECITRAHVAAEAARYPRPLVLLEDQWGWAVYAARDGRRRTEYRRNWIAALLDLAEQVAVVTRNAPCSFDP